MRSLHLRESSVNSFENKLWNSDGRIASLSTVQFLIADHENARLPLENLPNGVVAQTPQRCDFGNGVMPSSKLRCGLLFLVRFALGIVRSHWAPHELASGFISR